MKLTTVIAFSAIGALSVGCSLLSSSPSTRIKSGIAAYNNGDTVAAKADLEAALEATQDQPLMEDLQARAHFYLAAVAWDVGNVKKTDEHLRQCRSIQPLFEPDWTFVAPGLRKRYNNVRVKVKAVPKKPVTKKPTTAKPAP